MKVLIKKEELCNNCHTCENVCSMLYFKEQAREKSSVRIEAADNKNVIKACTQCGFCMDICPAEAIYRDKRGIVRINKDLCTGCFACVAFCPEGAMFRHKDYLEPFKCVACGACAKECPEGAIFMQEV